MSSQVNYVQNKYKGIIDTKSVVKTEPGVVSSKIGMAIEAKFQPFDSIDLKIIEIDSPECGALIKFYEKDNLYISVRVPKEYVVPRFKVSNLRNQSKRYVAAFNRESPTNKHGDIGYVLVLSGTVIHAIDSFILEQHKGNFTEITAQVVAVAQKHPYQPISKNNELRFLIRDFYEHYPVIEVYVEYGRKIPYIRPGFFIRCLGLMQTVTILKALRVIVLC